MPYDIPAMIEFQRRALVRLVEGVFVLAGLVPGGAAVDAFPVPVRLAILTVLRPAESALRRLIFAVSRRTVIKAWATRAAPTAPIPAAAAGAGRMSFQLFDRRKTFAELSPHRRRCGRTYPRIHYFDGLDPVYDDAPKTAPVSAAPLCARLQALHRALHDIPVEARRMLRVQARRRAASEPPCRTEPLRPGWPPGYRRRHRHPVDAILHECEILARRAAKPPDRG